MRRFFLFVTAIILLAAMTVGVSAAPSASDVRYYATVTDDSRCQVNMTITVHVPQPDKNLTFPIPADATEVSLNGSRVLTNRKDDKRHISLKKITGNSTGNITFNLSYSLPDVVHTNERGTLELQLPLLSGFAYTVEYFEFSVSLPATFTTLPGFTSGYHKAGIEEYLEHHVEGNTITGRSLAPMKDHETLSMHLAVSESLFPQGLTDIRDWSFAAIAMAICGGLALIYWLISLRFLPLQRQRCTQLPDGYTAGDLGSILHLRGMDLTLCVLSWAQLGYIMLQRDRSGRILLHKRMDMGNERKESEQKLFRALFARRNVVDTTSQHYARLCLESADKPKGLGDLVQRRSGNPKVFRVLASGIGLFGGVCIAITLGRGALLQWLLILLLGSLGAVSGYIIQSWGRCLTLRNPGRMSLCLILCAAWLLFSLLGGILPVGLGMVLGLLLAGLLLSWSGRRTRQGKLLDAQVRGLKRYLATANPEQLRQLTAHNGDYFFTLAPSAIALGQGPAFARRFGKQRLENCPYLYGAPVNTGTAAEWMQLLQKTVISMNRRAARRPLEKITQFFQGFAQLFYKR